MKKFSVIIIVLLSVGVAMAADIEPKPFDPVWREIGNYLGVLVAGLLASFVSRILKELEERKLISAQKEAELEAMMDVEASRVVAWVEAFAVKQGHKLEAEEKLAKAIQRLMDKFHINSDKAEELIEGALVPMGKHAGAKLHGALSNE